MTRTEHDLSGQICKVEISQGGNLLAGGTATVFMGQDAEIADDAFEDSEIVIMCLYGGTVFIYAQRMAYPVCPSTELW